MKARLEGWGGDVHRLARSYIRNVNGRALHSRAILLSPISRRGAVVNANAITRSRFHVGFFTQCIPNGKALLRYSVNRVRPLKNQSIKPPKHQTTKAKHLRVKSTASREQGKGSSIPSPIQPQHYTIARAST